MAYDPYNLQQYDQPGGAQQVSQALPQLLSLMGASGALGIQPPNPLEPKSMLPPAAQMGMSFAGQGLKKAQSSQQLSNPFGQSFSPTPPPMGGRNPMGGGQSGQRPPGNYSGQLGSRFGTMGKMGGASRQPPGGYANPASSNYSAYTNKLKKEGGIVGGIKNLLSGLGNTGKTVDWGALF